MSIGVDERAAAGAGAAGGGEAEGSCALGFAAAADGADAGEGGEEAAGEAAEVACLSSSARLAGCERDCPSFPRGDPAAAFKFPSPLRPPSVGRT